MPGRTTSVAFLGNDADLNAVANRVAEKLRATAVVGEESNVKVAKSAEVTGARIGEAYTAGTSKAGAALGRLGALGASFGIPMVESLDRVGKKLDETSAKHQHFVGTLAQAGKATLVAGGAGFAAVADQAVKLAEAYGTSTASIAANSGITQKAADRIGNAFLDTAGKSVFSGQQMAAAFVPVAGQLKLTEGHALGVADATKVMSAASDLAEASHAGLGAATSALSGVMQSYHLSVGQAAGASDQLFNVSKSINVPLEGVATALERLHGRLGELAPSLKDVSGLMLDLAGHGVTGQKGVQVVSTALSTLVGGGKNTSAVLKALGVSVFDQNGKFIGMQAVIAQLQPKLAGLTEHQRLFAEKALFGASAGRLMGQVIADGVPKFQASAAAAQKLGTAHQAAALQSKTFHNEMETLKASVLDLGTKFGAFLIPKLQAVVTATSDVIKWFGRHEAAAKVLAGVITGVLGLAISAYVYTKAVQFVDATGKMVGGIGKLVSGIGSAVPQILAKFGLISSGAATMETEVVGSARATAVGVDTALGATGVGLVLVGLGVAAVELQQHWKQVMNALKAATDWMAQQVEQTLNKLSSLVSTLTLGLVNLGQFGSGGGGTTPGTGANPSASTIFGGQAINSPGGLIPASQNVLSLMGHGIQATGQPRSVNPESFAVFTLQMLGIKPTTQNVRDFTAWEQQEGGNWANSAKFNPLNTTKGEPGSGSTGSQGNIGSYTSWAQGFAATIQTLQNYPTILAALKGNASLATFSAAVAASPWGTGAIHTSGITDPSLSGAAPSASTPSSGASSGSGSSAIQQLINQAGGGAAPGGKATMRYVNHRPVGAMTEAQWQAYQAAHPAAPTTTRSLLYATPFPGGATQGRTDMGIDFSAAPGSAVDAIGAGIIDKIIPNWFKDPKTGLAQPLIEEQLTAGPNKGKFVYYAEQIKSLVREGERVKAGQRIGTVAPTGTGLELGFGAGGGRTLAQATTGYHEGQVTPAGQAFAQFLKSIGQGVYTTTTAAGVTTGGGTGIGGTLASLVQNFMQALQKATTSLIQTYQSLEQSGSVKTLSKVLGVSTGGGVAQSLRVKIEGLDPTVIQNALKAGTDPHQLDRVLIPILEKAALKSQANAQFNTLVGELRAAGQGGKASALISARGGVFATLAQEMYAEQITKDAESLSLEATHLKDLTTLQSNTAAQALTIQKAYLQKEADQLAAQTTYIKDMSTFVQDQFSGIVQAIQDATQRMSDASSAVVQGIQDRTQIRVDILGERGLFGLNLLAQKEQVQLDVMKASYDQQIANAQINVDQVTATVHAAENVAQLHLDQVTTIEDQKVARAQQYLDTVTIAQNIKILAAQQHMDTVTLHEDVSLVGPAQTAVDLGATLPKAQQDMLGAILKRATGQAGIAEGKAAKAYQDIYGPAQDAIGRAQGFLTEATGKADRIIAQAGATLAQITGQGNQAIAEAGQTLQGIKDTAAQAEGTLQGVIDITKATASTQFAGSGLTVNLYGIPMDNAAAIGQTMDWFARTQLGALV